MTLQMRSCSRCPHASREKEQVCRHSASLRQYEFKPGKSAEVSQRVQEEFVPIISSAPGFLAYYLVIESHEVGVSVSVFETQAEAENGFAPSCSQPIGSNTVSPV